MISSRHTRHRGLRITLDEQASTKHLVSAYRSQQCNLLTFGHLAYPIAQPSTPFPLANQGISLDLARSGADGHIRYGNPVNYLANRSRCISLLKLQKSGIGELTRIQEPTKQRDGMPNFEETCLQRLAADVARRGHGDVGLACVTCAQRFLLPQGVISTMIRSSSGRANRIADRYFSPSQVQTPYTGCPNQLKTKLDRCVTFRDDRPYAEAFSLIRGLQSRFIFLSGSSLLTSDDTFHMTDPHLRYSLRSLSYLL